MNKKILIYGNKTKKEGNTIYVTEKDFYPPPFDYETEKESFDEISKIEDSSINGKDFPEYLSYEGISIWWYFRSGILQGCNIWRNFIRNFSEFLKKNEPDIVKIEDYNNFSIIKKIVDKNGIKIEYSEQELEDHNKKINEQFVKNRKKRTSFIQELQEKRIKIFNKKGIKNISINNKILFVAHPIFRRDVIDLNTCRTVRGEFIIDDILSLVQDKKDVVFLDFLSEFTDIERGDKILAERLSSSKNWITIESLSKKEVLKSHSDFLSKFNKFLESKEIKELFQFSNISYWEPIQKRFQSIKWNFLEYWLNSIDSFKQLFENQKPRKILLLTERNHIPSIIVKIAKDYNIPTIAFQHGIIHEVEKNYGHKKFEKHKPFQIPIPDKMMVFGEISREILIKNGFPSQNLTVFGNPTYFNLQKIEKCFRTNILEKKFGLKHNKKIILFFSSGWHNYFWPVGKFQYDLLTLEHLLENFSNNEEYEIIIKPHPFERTLPYRKIMDEYKANNFHIINSSILELIKISSIVVSNFSTTLFDSLCFKKPVIQVLYEDIYFKLPTDGFNVIFKVFLNELSTQIKLIINKSNVESNDDLEKFLKLYHNFPITQNELKKNSEIINK